MKASMFVSALELVRAGAAWRTAIGLDEYVCRRSSLTGQTRVCRFHEGANVSVPGRNLSRTEILERVERLAEKAGLDARELAIGHGLGFRSEEPYIADAHALLALLPNDDSVFQMLGPKRLPGVRRAPQGMRNADRRAW
jgi:hypothetical protein